MRQGMAVAEERLAAGQRDVDAARRGGRRGGRLVLFPPRLDGLLQLVGQPPDLALLVRRRAADRLHPRRDDAVLAAEKPVAHRLRVARGRRLRELGFEAGDLGLHGGGVGKRHRAVTVNHEGSKSTKFSWLFVSFVTSWSAGE